MQPGILDGGTCATDQIATLKRWIQLLPQGAGTNIVDAALAQPLNPGDVQNTIHDIGCVSSWREVSEVIVISNPADPDNVQKIGPTTGYPTLMALERVVGVGVSKNSGPDPNQGRWVIVVYVNKKIPPHQMDPGAMVPKQIEGVPTDVVEAGEPIPYITK